MGWSFVDTDQLVESRARLTIRELYAQHGEEAFRRIEAEVVREVGSRDRQVVSTGGGVVLSDANVAELRRDGKLIWLKAPAEVLWHRILGDQERLRTRPPVDPATGLQQIREALAAREPLYERAADATVETQDRSVVDIVNTILLLTGLKGDP
ncbi:MAG: hypothetical protein AMXMBFR83_29350 [Phycisphaerae bacterium]